MGLPMSTRLNPEATGREGGRLLRLPVFGLLAASTVPCQSEKRLSVAQLNSCSGRCQIMVFKAADHTSFILSWLGVCCAAMASRSGVPQPHIRIATTVLRKDHLGMAGRTSLRFQLNSYPNRRAI